MSSAKQTESEDESKAGDQAAIHPAIHPAVAGAIVGVTLLVLGWGLILHINRWHWTAPVFFLFCGWAAILLTARFLWQAGWAAANEPVDRGEDFLRPVGEKAELEAEKRALVKAIKEIEFDYQMGKMSDDDAAELTRYYRLRAIEVIKALESATDGGDDELPVRDRIARDVQARLELDKKRKKAKARKKAGKKAAPEKAGKKAAPKKAAPNKAEPEDADEAPADAVREAEESGEEERA
jgi:hypothetical protein